MADPEALKQRIATLKDEIRKKRTESADTTLPKFTVDKALPTGPAPRIRRVLKGHTGKVSALQWSEEKTNSTLATAALDGKILIWNAATMDKLVVVPLKSTWVMSCGYTSQHGFIASGGLENIVSVFGIRTKPIKTARELVGHDGFITCCRFIDDKHLLTSSGDYTSALWDVEHSTLLRSFAGPDGHTAEVLTIATSPDYSVFVSASADQTAKLWDVKSGKCINTFYGHQNDVNSLSFFPGGNAFTSGSDDCKATMWDIRAMAEVVSFTDDSVKNGITAVAHSASGHYLFASYDDFTLRMWDVLTGKPLHNWGGHNGKISCMGVSGDGMALCTGSWDYSLKLWA